MTRRLITGFALVLVMAWMIACSGGFPSQPTTPTAVPTAGPAAPVTPPAASPDASVEPFIGDWSPDPVTDPAAIAEAEATAARSCSQVEFKAVRDVDSKTAAVVFVATCARMRVHAVGTGRIGDDKLFWKAEGTVRLPSPSDRTCPAPAVTFGQGSYAQPVREGLIKVAYNGKVCGIEVSGTAIVRRR
jgi:hypothetical protein